MLFFRVYSESDPRPLSSPRNLCSLCVSALSFSFLSHSTFQRSNFPTCERSSYNPFRINTYKSVTKQTTLTLFRINTYEKHRGEGASSFQSPSPIPYPLSPLFSNSSELFCTFLHSRKTQLLSFHAIPPSFTKTPGVWGALLPSRAPRFAEYPLVSTRNKMKPETANSAVLCIPCALRDSSGRQCR
jgi:hypothetical protein